MFNTFTISYFTKNIISIIYYIRKKSQMLNRNKQRPTKRY